MQTVLHTIYLQTASRMGSRIETFRKEKDFHRHQHGVLENAKAFRVKQFEVKATFTKASTLTISVFIFSL